VLAAGKPHRTPLLRSLLRVRKQALLDALRVLVEAGSAEAWADGLSSRFPRAVPGAGAYRAGTGNGALNGGESQRGASRSIFDDTSWIVTKTVKDHPTTPSSQLWLRTLL
jgi:hypothetical protein